MQINLCLFLPRKNSLTLTISNKVTLTYLVWTYQMNGTQFVQVAGGHSKQDGLVRKFSNNVSIVDNNSIEKIKILFFWPLLILFLVHSWLKSSFKYFTLYRHALIYYLSTRILFCSFRWNIVWKVFFSIFPHIHNSHSIF